MTTTARAAGPGADAWSLLCRQVEAIDAWHARRRQQDAADVSRGDSLEVRIDRRWRADVLRREHAVIVEHCDAHLRATGDSPWRQSPHAVVVHRHPWAGERLAHALQERGIRVVAVLDNGADAVGAVVVDQPELVVLSDVLPMVSSLEVVREVRALAPATRAVVLVEHARTGEQLAEAGAVLTLPRATPCAQAADEVLAMHARSSG